MSRRNVYCEERALLPALASRSSLVLQEVRWESALRQPSNMLTNLPFYVAAARVLTLGARDIRRCGPPVCELERHPAFSLLFGTSLLWVFLGSTLFHASWSRLGQRLDMGGVYAVLLVPVCHVLRRLGVLGRAGGPAFVALSALLCSSATALKWRLKSSSLVPQLAAALTALIALWLGLGSPVDDSSLPQSSDAQSQPPGPTMRWWLGPVQRRRPAGLDMRLLLGSAASILLAFAAAQIDAASGLRCVPRGAWQWHGVWHLCSAASLWLLYAFFRSEAPAAE